MTPDKSLAASTELAMDGSQLRPRSNLSVTSLHSFEFILTLQNRNTSRVAFRLSVE